MAKISVLPLPLSSGRVDLLPATNGRRGDYALGDIARKLRIAHLSIRTIIDQLRILHEQAGMPLPVSPRIHGGRLVRGAASIHKNSLWDAARFDAWQNRFDPPAAEAEVAVTAHLRRELAARAATVATAGRRGEYA